jgi:predicted nucleotidyltransferase
MRTSVQGLSGLLFGQTRSRVLTLLYGVPDRSFFVRQIARETSSSVGTVQRELEALSEVGLIKRSLIGRQVFYQANRSHPVFEEMRSLIAKTAGIFYQLRSALTPLAEKISLAFVFGSIVRGDESADSDVDLMVVGNVPLDEILACLAPVERALGRSINPTVYSSKEFRSKLADGNHFLSSVLRGKKHILIGEESELGKMG